MSTFNSKNFIKSLKERYDAIPYREKDSAAKYLAINATKTNSFDVKDVCSFIFKEMNPLGSLSNEDWNGIINLAIKYGGALGHNLEVLNNSLKDTLSSEVIFNLAVSGCGKDPEALKCELYLDRYGWLKAVNTLVKKAVKKPVVETKKAKAVKKVKKSSTKTIKADSRRKSITLINVKTGEKKTWESYRACEIELFNDPKLGHGTVSQLVSGKVKRILKVWELYKEEGTVSSTPAKPRRRSKLTEVIQYLPDGSTKVWSSITEASKETGICHSSISKSANGVKGYETAGGYKWGKSAEAAA